MDILKIENLTKTFRLEHGFLKKHTGEIKAVNKVSLSIEKGTTYGLVGESGSGKSTLARILLGLLNPDSGRVLFENNDIFSFKKKNFLQFRKKTRIVFQDPVNSLDPRYTIKRILKESLNLLSKKNNKDKMEDKINKLLATVNLPLNIKNNFPHQISGGQAQRVCIARALCGNPELVILDEPTSGLDITTAYNLINLLIELQNKMNISYLFITHDLKIARKISKKIAVMLKGNIVEEKLSEDLFNNPQNPYTKTLLKACLF